MLGDTHIPYLDVLAYTALEKLLRQIKPDKIILNGDIIDLWEISHFDKNPSRINEIERDISLTRGFLRSIRDNFPLAEIIYLFGNHEYRMKKYVWKMAPACEPFKLLRLENMLGLDELKIKYYTEDNDYHQEGILLVTHGTIVNKDSGMTARRMLCKYGMSVIHDHTHRLGSHFKTDCTGTRGAWENGCLCKLELAKEWRTGYPPDWQHGASLVWMRKDRQLFHVDQIYIHKGSFVYGGKQY